VGLGRVEHLHGFGRGAFFGRCRCVHKRISFDLFCAELVSRIPVHPWFGLFAILPILPKARILPGMANMDLKIAMSD
jgi:hypothetical protein